MNVSGRAMAEGVSLSPHTVDVRVRSQISPCEVCCGKHGTGTGFYPSTYHSTNAPYWSSSTCCCHQKGKRAIPGNLEKGSAISKVWSICYKGTYSLKDYVYSIIIIRYV